MPCYDSRTDDDARITRERLDRATRAACELAIALQNVLENGGEPVLSVETLDWIKEHEEMDRDKN